MKAESNLTTEAQVKIKQKEIYSLNQTLSLVKKNNLETLKFLKSKIQALSSELKTIREQVLLNDFIKMAPAKSQQIWARQIVTLSQQILQQAEIVLIQQHA